MKPEPRPSIEPLPTAAPAGPVAPRETATGPLRNLWYLMASAGEVRRGRLHPVPFRGDPLVLGRAADGTPFALRDLCPHRGVPLHHGRLADDEITCCYHGWRFGTDGRCTAIPALVEGQRFDVSRVRVRSYPCREVQGNLWVFVGDRAPSAGPDAEPEPPHVPGLGDRAPRVTIVSNFPCDTGQALYGLIDPLHVPFVHSAWWWKRKRRELREKQKRFEPVPFGWRMVRHELPKESRIYRLLGRPVTTEITFRLPGLRIEHVEGVKHSVGGLTAMTPLADGTTLVRHCIWWTIPWLGLFTPIVRRMARKFLMQDRDVLVKQHEGLAHHPRQMLVPDGDTQLRWFDDLVAEWRRSQTEGRPYTNPIPARTLSWRS